MQEHFQRTIYSPPIRGFLKALNVRDRETAVHSLLVSSVAVEIGYVMGIDQEQLVQLHMGAVLHDVGKLAIPDGISSKPTRLDKHELKIMRRHPVIGYSLIGSNDHLHAAMNVILSHHERYDGLGYPFGLESEDIHLLARICAVADTLAAMTLERPYQKKVSIPTAVAEMRRCRGTQFDPLVVDTLSFIDMKKMIESFLINVNVLKSMSSSYETEHLADAVFGKVI